MAISQQVAMPTRLRFTGSSIKALAPPLSRGSS